MIYISVSSSYIRLVSISPKYCLRNLRGKGINSNLKLLKSNKIVEQAALAQLTQFNNFPQLTQLTQLDMTKENDGVDWVKETKGTESTNRYLNNLNIQHFVNANFSSIIKNTNYNCAENIPLTGEQINITSIYLNIDKVKGVYFAKDVKNVIFTLPDNLSDLYYYDIKNDKNDKKGNDIKSGVIYKISNKTRINMKGLDRFVFQRFNNNIDGILF